MIYSVKGFSNSAQRSAEIIGPFRVPIRMLYTYQMVQHFNVIMFSRFDTIPALHGQTDRRADRSKTARQTETRYQYRRVTL